MTVAYVCRVQQDVSHQMSLGFASCMREVDSFLAQCGTGTGSDVTDAELRAHLVRRLSRCCRRRFRHLGSSGHVTHASSSSSGYGGGASLLLPRKLCFDEDPDAVGSGARSALRDINVNNMAMHTGDANDTYRRPTTTLRDNTQFDFLYEHQQRENAPSVGVETISSTTSAASAHHGRPGAAAVVEHTFERPSSSCSSLQWRRPGGHDDVENSVPTSAVYDLSYKRQNVSAAAAAGGIKAEPFSPVWRPW